MKITAKNFIVLLIISLVTISYKNLYAQNSFWENVIIKAGYHSGFNPNGTNYAPTEHSSLTVGGFNSMSFRINGLTIAGSYSHNLDENGYIIWEPELKLSYSGHEQNISLFTVRPGNTIYLQKSVIDHLLLTGLSSQIKFKTSTEIIGFFISISPQLNIILNKNSELENYIKEIERNYIDNNSKISGSYNTFFLGGFLGFGVDYNKTLPIEIILEARYNFDLTNRFHFHYEINDYPGKPDMYYFSNSWEFMLGIKLRMN